jgi:hypothetical protein
MKYMVSSFQFFSFPSSDMAKKIQISNRNFHFKFQTEIFISNFKNGIFYLFHFKNKNFQIFISFFLAYFKIFQISIQISKSIFCSHFPVVVWLNFLKFKNKNFQFKCKKINFFHFKFSL